MRFLDKDRLVARLRASSVENGGTAIIPDAVYEIINVQYNTELDEEIEERMKKEIAILEKNNGINTDK